MKRNNIYMAAVAIAVALVFMLPSATVVANVGTIGVTSNIEDTLDMENMVESTNSDTIETTINTEDLVIDPRREPIVIDVEKLGSVDREESPVIDVEKLATETDASSIVSATGNTIYVDDDADPSWYNATQVKTVLEGVVNATAGDTVYVYNGFYPNEEVLVDKVVNLTGESKENVILEGGGFEAGNIFTVTANQVNITNFTMRNCRTAIILQSSSSSNTVTNCDIYLARNGILVYSSNNLIMNCNVYDISTYSVRIDAANYNTLINCSIHDSTYYGLYIDEGSYNTIINCSVYNHTNRGIRVAGDDTARSIGNSFIGCEVYNIGGHGIYLDYFCDYTNFTNCDIHDNYYVSDTSPGNGLYIRCWPGDASYASITNCTIHDNPEYGIHLARARHATLRYNTIYDNNKNFGITASSADDFYMDIDSSNTINGKPMYYIVNQNDLELDGYNFGYLGLISCTNITVRNADTYGILLVDTVNTTIFNVSSHQVMEGVWATWGSSNIDLVNCTFYDNSWGISFTSVSNIDVVNCTAYDNTESGIQLDRCLSINVTDSNFYNNALGMFLDHSQNVALVGNEIDNNMANFHVDGTGGYPEHFVHDIDTSNTINGKPMYYLVGQSNMTLDETDNCGYVGLVSCTNITVKNADTSGILLVETTYSTISNVSAHNDMEGIYLQTSTYNIITNCDSYNNGRRNINLFYYSTNNDIIDCNFYNSYDPKYGGIGLWSYNTNNNFINCSSYNNAGYGIYFTYDSDNNNFTNCEIYNNNDRGIYIDSASNLKFRGNDIYNNVYNFDVLESFDTHDIDTSNTINGKPMYYLIGQSDLTIDETNNPGYVGLISCTNITVKNADVSGILLVGTTDSTISNVSSHNSVCGILLEESPNTNIMDFTSYNNYDGIYLDDSSNSNLTNCDAYNNIHYGINARYSEYCNFIDCDSDNSEYGIYIYRSHYSNFIDCDFSNNEWDGAYARLQDSNFINCSFHDNGRHGIQFTSSNAKYNNIDSCISYNNENGITFWSSARYNNVINCTVYDNTYGIYVYATSAYSNLLHHNNFVNNFQNAYDPALNTWDDGYPSGGNYLDDYTGIDIYSGPGQNISGSDGIGDTPYNIPGKTPPNQDRYPLMVPLDNIPPVITDVTATPAVQTITDPVNITCTVTDNWDMVDIVKVNISGPEGFTLETTMNKGSSYYYENIYTTMGIYNFFIWANDTRGNIAVSDTYMFIIAEFDKPTSGVNTLPTWMTTVPFTVTATAFDSSGVANVTLYYRHTVDWINWTDWTYYDTDTEAPWQWQFTGNDGYYEFYSIAVDTNENVEDPPEIADASCGLDTEPPVTTIILDGTLGVDGWYVSSVTVTLSASDNTSGVDSTWYKINSGYWQFYGSPFTLSDDGEYMVYYRSYDNAGNQEGIKSVDIKIDKTAPETEHEFDGVIGEGGWFVSNVTVTISAEDLMPFVLRTSSKGSSGVNYTIYKLNDGTWTIYTEPFNVTEDDTYTLYYYSVDLAGNTEPTNEVEFMIEHDTTPPVTTHEFNGIPGENDWFTSNVAVTLSAEDDSAGVDYTMYKLDEGEWTEYTGLFLVTEDGDHTIMYFSVDKVGNEEDEKGPFDFKIDQTPPTIELTWDEENSKLVADVDDETSGVANVEFYVNGEILGEVTTAPYEWEVTNPTTGDKGQAIVYDNAGNNAISAEIDAVSQSQSLSSSPAPRLFSWLFGV